MMEADHRMLVRIPDNADALLYTGIERLEAKAFACFGRRLVTRPGLDDAVGADGDDSVEIVLALRSDLPAALRNAVGLESETPDAYAIRPVPRNGGHVIVLTGSNARGCLFAAHALADQWETHGRVEPDALAYEPVTPHRWVLFQYGVSGGHRASKRFNLSRASIEEFPRHGINGVYLYNAPVWPWYTFEMAQGQPQLVETEAAELKSIFREFKAQGLEIAYACPIDFPSDYSVDQISAYLRGELELPGYLETFQQYHRTLLEAFIAQYPEVDALVVSMAEGAMGWGFNQHSQTARIAKALFQDQAGQDVEICAEVFRAYLDVFDEVTRRHGKQALFQTHHCGPTNRAIWRMRELVDDYPDIVQIEDDRWNNSGWVNLPILGYLSQERQEAFLARQRTGMKVICEGEFLGGGAMPTCIPEPLQDASMFTVKHGMSHHLTRIDLHERTEHGTLFGINEINFLAAMAPMWTPQPSLEALWDRWLKRRFGEAAAGELKPVLQSAWQILYQGTMVSEMPLLHSSRLMPKDWKAGGANPIWDPFLRFRRPGTPIVTRPDEEVSCGEQMAWQLNAKSVPIASVREAQSQAQALNQRCIDRIHTLKPKLREADYHYLLRVFTTTKVVIEALAAAAEGAYAAEIMRDNYDAIEDPETLFQQALDKMAQTAAHLDQACACSEVYTEYLHLAPALREIAGHLQESIQSKAAARSAS